MSHRDFQRTMPGSNVHLQRPDGLWRYTHLDGWLLLLLLLLCGFGLLCSTVPQGRILAM